MKTYTSPKELVENPHYQVQREKSLSGLDDVIIDPPINDLVDTLNKCPYCFTLQSCYGHFIHDHRQPSDNLDPLPLSDDKAKVTYRIAYFAFCIENSVKGRRMLKRLEAITAIDPENIQFFSADWFWERQVNSYALQVEPERFKHEDKATLDYKEALKIERLRDAFFRQLKTLLTNMASMEDGIEMTI